MNRKLIKAWSAWIEALTFGEWNTIPSKWETFKAAANLSDDNEASELARSMLEEASEALWLKNERY